MVALALIALAATVDVDGNQTFQTIDGFGSNINSLSFTGANSREAIDVLAGQMGQTLWRVVFDMMDWEDPNDNGDPMSPNAAYYDALYGNAKFQNLWGTLRYLNQKGFSDTVAVSFMGPLSTWLGGANLPTAQEDEAVEAIVSLIVYARGTAQVRFGLLDPFNESDWNGNEGPRLPAAQYVRVLGKLLTRLDAAGITDLKLVGPNTADVNTGVSTYVPAMLSSPAVLARTHRFGFHSYSGNTGSASGALAGTAGFWMTEYALPEHAFPLLQQGARGLLVWEGFDSIYNHAIARGEPAVPGNDDVGSVPLEFVAGSPVTYRPRKELYQNAQLFKYVPPGSVRVATSGNLGGLDAVAFVHQATRRVTLVLRNPGAATTAMGTLRNVPELSSLAQVRTDATSDLAPGPDVPVTQGRYSVAVPAGAWLTLTGIGAGADGGAAGGAAGGMGGGAAGGPAGGGTSGGAAPDAGSAGGSATAGGSGTAGGTGAAGGGAEGLSGTCGCRSDGGALASAAAALLAYALRRRRR